MLHLRGPDSQEEPESHRRFAIDTVQIGWRRVKGNSGAHASLVRAIGSHVAHITDRELAYTIFLVHIGKGQFFSQFVHELVPPEDRVTICQVQLALQQIRLRVRAVTVIVAEREGCRPEPTATPWQDVGSRGCRFGEYLRRGAAAPGYAGSHTRPACSSYGRGYN